MDVFGKELAQREKCSLALGVDPVRDIIEFNEGAGKDDILAPFKDNHLVIADNHDVAKRRLKCLVNGLSDKPKTLQGYNNVIQEQLRKDNIEEVGQQVREMKINWYDEQPPKISGISIKIVQDIIGTGQPRYNRCFRKTSTLMMCKRCSSMEMETGVKLPYLA